MPDRGRDNAVAAYAEALEDFLGILEHYAQDDFRFDIAEDLDDAADNLFEAAYDANLGVWLSD